MFSPTSSPTPIEQVTDEQDLYTTHKLQDRLQHILSLTKSRSHKTGKERSTTVTKGNDAHAAMEAVISARESLAEVRRTYDQKCAEAAVAEGAYHDAIRRTLEKTEALEKQVKTVTMRADSLAFNETDFFQSLIDRQEEAINYVNLAPLSVDRAHCSRYFPPYCLPKRPDQYRLSGRIEG